MLKSVDIRFLAALILPWALWAGLTVMLLPMVAGGAWYWAPLLFIASGLLQYWCIIAIHEAIHQHFLKQTRLSRLVALLCAYPIGLDRNYSWIHFDHHKYFPDSERDPDWPNYGDYPRSLATWLKRLFLIGSGLAVLLQFFQQRRHLAKDIPEHRNFRGELPYKIGVQLALLGLFSFFGFLPGYVLFWLVPLVTQAKFLSFLRTFAEHAHPEHLGVLRVFAKPSLLDRYLAHFGFIYHSEHHLRANVPYTELAQRSLIGTDAAPSGDVPIVVYDGGHLQWHWQLLRSLYKAASWRLPSNNLTIKHEQILHLPLLPK